MIQPASGAGAPEPSRATSIDAELWQVEVRVRADLNDSRGNAALHELKAADPALAASIRSVRSVRGFAIALPRGTGRPTVEMLAREVLSDAVSDGFDVRALEPSASPAALPAGFDHRIVVAKKPGVMDPGADGVIRVLKAAGTSAIAARTYGAFLVAGSAPKDALRAAAARCLGNEAIEEISVDDPRAAARLSPLQAAHAASFRRVEVPLPDGDAALQDVSKRGGLSLSLLEMQAIRAHYRELGRAPTDIELETIAQTWSEHCKHKTLAGAVECDGRSFKNLLKETIFAATQELALPWCISVFVDNAGVIAFDERFHVTFKVETHNHPSAIEPYGGAGTGIGGVLRDTMGTGLGAKPIVSTDVFCFGPPDLPAGRVPKGSLHPLRVLKGVVSGVRDYGNRMGIPTVNGAVLFDERYTANPLVFCGSVGLLPVDRVKKAARPGDLVVVVGGRTGRDGIHGATFSSRELHSESETLDSGAVQIGNAITEKRVLDALLIARDQNLFSTVTDCGAGGLSSAVGETAADCGAEVDLDRVPLKYAGLTYTETWISEAQERMVLAVPPQNRERLLKLFADEDVEATVIGRYTDTNRLVLRSNGVVVGDLDLGFLHDGLPRVTRKATVRLSSEPEPKIDAPADLGAALMKLLSMPDVASKEWIVRQYDHEVQAGTCVKPFAGRGLRSPSDAAVAKPRLDSWRGIAIGCGVHPWSADIDPYAMGLLAIDEAVRNVIATGARADRIAILDNFCAGNCERPETLGQVVRVAEACRDAALALGTPFISGKDSLNNEYRTETGSHAIPTTLLVSSIGLVDDVRRAVTTPFKSAGRVVIAIGNTRPELGGSRWYALHGKLGRSVPRVDLATSKRTFAAIAKLTADGVLAACHDLSDGGLAVALAEMTFGSDAGVELDLRKLPRDAGAAASADAPPIERDDVLLFSESPTRFLAEVDEKQVDRVRAALGDVPWAVVGKTIAERRVRVTGLAGKTVIDRSSDELHRAFSSALDFGSPVSAQTPVVGAEGRR